MKKFKPTLLVPVNFPAAFDVDDPFLAQKISLNKMRYWNQAPANPKAIAAAGIKFAFTSSDLKSVKDFLTNIRKAVSIRIIAGKSTSSFDYNSSTTDQPEKAVLES